MGDAWRAVAGGGLATAAELRAAARALYEARAAELALRPWVAGGWRDGAPTPKQRVALTRVAGSDLAQLTASEAEVVRAVAIRPDAVGAGAVADCLAVAVGSYHRQQQTARPAPAAAFADAPAEASLRLAVVAAVLTATPTRLAAARAALGLP